MRPTPRSSHRVDALRTIFITDPETGDDVRTGDIIPDVAVAPNGDLYAVWQDARDNDVQADGDRCLEVDGRRLHLVASSRR